MDMLYFIYIGNNRTAIDHLTKVTGGMFMAVSSCNKAAKVIDGIRERYNTSILYEQGTLEKTAGISPSFTNVSRGSTTYLSRSIFPAKAAKPTCRQASTTPSLPWQAKKASGK